MENPSAASRPLALSALIWSALGLGVALYLEICYADAVDQFRQTFSEYVYTEQGARLAGVAMLALGFAWLSAAGALRAARVPGARTACWLIVVWSAGLVVLALFPQEPADVPLTWHGAIHRHAALAGFVTLPIAAWRLRHLAPALRWLAVAALALLGLFVLTFLPGAEPLRDYSGLVERLLLGSHLAVLGVLLTALRRRDAEPDKARQKPQMISIRNGY
ncbi:DUF998 domain-containing protein [Amycolatopsis anabasis]|uniref:DUF998 domain-containing protein n=1 Tax=Amycolatopsis anabasis TaxID=1840409 RepID=UPI00131B2B64|nr:DUF998 domain-containing protein [Amycolatopsis anabasis]